MEFLIYILNFVNDNYIKFAIALVLCLMAIIGYYAEKTNFGNKLKQTTENDSQKINKKSVKNQNISSDKKETKKMQKQLYKKNMQTLSEIQVIRDNLKTLMDSDDKGDEKQADIFVNDLNESDVDDILSNDTIIKQDFEEDITNMDIDPLEEVSKDDINEYAKLKQNIKLPEIDDYADDDVWDF